MVTLNLPLVHQLAPSVIINVVLVLEILALVLPVQVLLETLQIIVLVKMVILKLLV